MDRNDIRVPQVRQVPRLVEEPFYQRPKRRFARPQHFDSDVPAQGLLPGQVYNPHSAAAQLAYDLVVTRQRRRGAIDGVVDGRRDERFGENRFFHEAARVVVSLEQNFDTLAQSRIAGAGLLEQCGAFVRRSLHCKVEQRFFVHDFSPGTESALYSPEAQNETKEHPRFWKKSIKCKSLTAADPALEPG